MNRQFLLNKGIDNDLICEAVFGIDQISSSGFDSIEDFLFDYCFDSNDELLKDYSRTNINYYVVSGENKTIRVLIWFEKQYMQKCLLCK